jgi:hypothetical protein
MKASVDDRGLSLSKTRLGFCYINLYSQIFVLDPPEGRLMKRMLLTFGLLSMTLTALLFHVSQSGHPMTSTDASFVEMPTAMFNLDAFAHRMGVKPMVVDDKAPAFSRVNVDSHFGTAMYEVATKKYSCAQDMQITLIAMNHAGDAEFFKYANEEASKADVFLYEGLRQEYFYGPPFEKDPRVQSEAEYKDLTLKRLQTLKKMVVSFQRQEKRNPKSFTEIKNAFPIRIPAEFFKKQNLDAWGHEFQLSLKSDGHVDVYSLGADGKGKDSQLHAVVAAHEEASVKGLAPIEAIDGYTKFGREVGLTLQNNYPMTSYFKSGSYSADVSADMLMGDIPLKEKIKANSLRNVIAIKKLDEVLRNQKNKPHSIAIMYGASHMLKFHQYLLGSRFSCREVSTEWHQVMTADGHGNLSPVQYARRFSFIRSLLDSKPHLDADPLSLHDALAASTRQD